ncbi:response regulator transcription factor [Novosphingobium sp. SL115]|uniref:response regulator n=1 Tax=Novosphingobium sp. SL115 TaxID=2995150 RepID=UPI0022738647|nr:response regulator transcription factor [Novosphingobium sp. SL115]MCY1672645.1 response regulator transcription factor [Novosphingobium sp. SL115]
MDETAAHAANPVPARIAIIEDDPVVRQYFMRIIASDTGYDIVGIAPDIATGRALIRLKPDLFLMDIGLPDGSGYDLVPEIKAGSQAKALVISAFGDRDTVVRALSAGADGYLLKDSTPAQVLDGIAITLAGGAPVSPAAAVYLLDLLRNPPVTSEQPASTVSDERLTPRETDLLRAFSEGKSYKEAARALGISPHTVGNHVKSIYRKLEVTSRSEALFATGMRKG